jgi:hypothetical protein
MGIKYTKKEIEEIDLLFRKSVKQFNSQISSIIITIDPSFIFKNYKVKNEKFIC